MDVKQQNNINNKQYQNTGLKPGIWCIEDRTSVWQLPDIKTLKWSKVSGASKVVQLSGSWMTSKPWREARPLVTSYSSLKQGIFSFYDFAKMTFSLFMGQD